MIRKSPKVLIFSGFGLNCEQETKYAFELAGGSADIVHLNTLVEKPQLLRSYQILTIPGGFSFGDDTGSGAAYAQLMRTHLWEELLRFTQKDRLVLGICNGFQILVSLGLLPALNEQKGTPQIALLPNTSARYTVRWVDVQTQNDSPWLSKMETCMLPIAHGEGRLHADTHVLEALEKNNQIALQYVTGEACNYQSLSANPNGSLADIAGLSDPSGRILGLMPHPERAVFFTQQPNWTVVKESYLRAGKKIPKYGPGLQLFKNAVGYFK